MFRSQTARVFAGTSAPAPAHAVRLLLLAITFTLMLSSFQGCYKRVVAARGMGADQYDVAEPYQENSKVDDWVFGQRPARNNTRLKNMSNVGE